LGTPQLVTLGVDAQWQRDQRRNRDPLRLTVVLEQTDRVFEVGPFVQTRFGVGSRVTVTAGVRYDRVRFRVQDRLPLIDSTATDRSGRRVLSALSGSGGVAFRATEALVPYFSVGTSFETPTTTELINRPDGSGGLNLDLRPQRATNYEIGARGRVGAVLSYSVTAFRTDVRDELIPFESPVEPGRTVFRNAGSSTHRGVETGATVRPVPGLTARAVYTLADYRFDEFRVEGDTLDGNRIPGVPVHYLYLSARYESRGGFWGAIDNTYGAGAYVDDRNTEAAKADGWWVLTLRAGWEVTIDRWRVAPYVSVLNLTDRRYAGSVVVNARGGRYFEPAPGRNLVLGLEIGAR
jgi:iron complex outermembrane receptor protein